MDLIESLKALKKIRYATEDHELADLIGDLLMAYDHVYSEEEENDDEIH